MFLDYRGNDKKVIKSGIYNLTSVLYINFLETLFLSPSSNSKRDRGSFFTSFASLAGCLLLFHQPFAFYLVLHYKYLKGKILKL